ncbi:MAG TPA: DegT/DnrJ/EryC1/StrS family aminotransferase [Candidatus Manganitrophaceae bacterium]
MTNKDRGSKKYFIPAFPPLAPRALARSVGGGLSFPFNHPGYTDYYFGRSAVWHGVKSLGLTARDRVLVPAYHHGVEVEAILRAGPAVDFYRVDSRLRIDLEDARKKMTPETRVFYLIYYLGFPQPVEELLRLRKERPFFLMEDCALSLFSRSGGNPFGAFGDLSVFSFHKTLPVPNGGGLVIREEREGTPGSRATVRRPPPRVAPPFISTLSHLSASVMNHLKMERPTAGRLVHSVLKKSASTLLHMAGIERTSVADAEFDPEKTAWGMSALSKRILKSIDLPDVVARRRENFAYLLDHLDLQERFVFETLPEGVCPLFFPLLAPDKERVRRELLAHGIETINFWSVPHPSTPRGVYAESEYLRSHLLEVPIHQGLDKKRLDYMISKLRKALR